MQVVSQEHAFLDYSTSHFFSPDDELFGSFEEEAISDPEAVLDFSFKLKLIELEVLFG